MKYAILDTNRAVVRFLSEGETDPSAVEVEDWFNLVMIVPEKVVTPEPPKENPLDKLKAFLAANPDVANILG